MSHGFWQRRFGGDPERRRAHAADREHRAPRSSASCRRTSRSRTDRCSGRPDSRASTTIDLWAPMAFAGPLAAANRMLTPQGQLVRGTHWLGAIGRMKPGVTVEQVQADMSTVARQLEQTYPGHQRRLGRDGACRCSIRRSARSAAPLLVLLAGVGVRADHRGGERRQPRARAQHRAAEGARDARRARRRTRGA